MIARELAREAKRRLREGGSPETVEASGIQAAQAIPHASGMARAWLHAFATYAHGVVASRERTARESALYQARKANGFGHEETPEIAAESSAIADLLRETQRARKFYDRVCTRRFLAWEKRKRAAYPIRLAKAKRTRDALAECVQISQSAGVTTYRVRGNLDRFTDTDLLDACDGGPYHFGGAVVRWRNSAEIRLYVD